MCAVETDEAMRRRDARESEVRELEMHEEFLGCGEELETDAVEVLAAEVALALHAYAEHLSILVSGVGAGCEAWDVGCEGDGVRMGLGLGLRLGG